MIAVLQLVQRQASAGVHAPTSRTKAIAEEDHRAVPEGARHQAQYRDDRGKWNPDAHRSAIQSAAGPDIIMAINNWPQL
jgi:hypothetical protein